MILSYLFGNGCFPKWINFKLAPLVCSRTVPTIRKSFMYHARVFAAVEGMWKMVANLATAQGNQDPCYSAEIVCHI